MCCTTVLASSLTERLQHIDTEYITVFCVFIVNVNDLDPRFHIKDVNGRKPVVSGYFPWEDT